MTAATFEDGAFPIGLEFAIRGRARDIAWSLRFPSKRRDRTETADVVDEKATKPAFFFFRDVKATVVPAHESHSIHHDGSITPKPAGSSGCGLWSAGDEGATTKRSSKTVLHRRYHRCPSMRPDFIGYDHETGRSPRDEEKGSSLLWERRC